MPRKSGRTLAIHVTKFRGPLSRRVAIPRSRASTATRLNHLRLPSALTTCACLCRRPSIVPCDDLTARYVRPIPMILSYAFPSQITDMSSQPGILVGNTLKQSLLVTFKLPNERLRNLEATGTVYSAVEQILQVRSTNAPFQVESEAFQDAAPAQKLSLWENRNKCRLHLIDPVVMAPGVSCQIGWRSKHPKGYPRHLD
jgi:hypothetical protein